MGFARRSQLWLATALLGIPGSQSVARAQSVGAHPSPFLDSFSRDAASADTSAGRLEYSKHLLQSLFSNRLGEEQTSALSQRLAAADLAARVGKRAYIDESGVAAAFNRLMKVVGDGGGTRFVTDAATVHRLRLAIYGLSPGLTTVSAHSSACLPTEALFFVEILVINEGLYNPKPHSGAAIGTGVRVTVSNRPAAAMILNGYLNAHQPSGSAKLCDTVFKELGI